jgi:hypothetical protein
VAARGDLGAIAGRLEASWVGYRVEMSLFGDGVRELESGPPKRPGGEAGDVMRGRAQQWAAMKIGPVKCPRGDSFTDAAILPALFDLRRACRAIVFRLAGFPCKVGDGQ